MLNSSDSQFNLISEAEISPGTFPIKLKLVLFMHNLQIILESIKEGVPGTSG